MELESRGLHRNTNPVSEDFGSLLNIKSSENSGITAETKDNKYSEIANQMSTKLEELKSDRNTKILQAISTAITVRVLLTLQNSLGVQKSGRLGIKVDFESNGLHKNAAVESCPELGRLLKSRCLSMYPRKSQKRAFN